MTNPLHARRRPVRSTGVLLAVTAAAAVTLTPATGAHAGGATPTCFGRDATLTDADARGGIVRGTDRADVVAVRDPHVAVFAGAGADRVCGSAWVLGGAGDDRILIGRWTEEVPDLNGEAGHDRIVVSNGLMAHLRGGTGHDVLLATTGRQFLSGGRGDDELSGGRGPDHLSGDDGEDSLRGGPGADTLLGGADRDVLQGESGDDVLRGGDGVDEVAGGDGDDELHGGPGNDYVGGWDGTDEGWGGEGSDECSVSTETRHGCEILDPTT
jgi:Ca2+-binding RTX toxin-like protein